MKFVAITLLAFIAAVYAAPTSISDNNIGNIVTVGVNANLSLDNKVEQNIISVIVALLSQQEVGIGFDGNQGQAPADSAKLEISPEMIENVKNLLMN